MTTAFLILVPIGLYIMSSLLAAHQSSNSSLDNPSIRRIAVVVCLFNAGISTRGLEIANALAAVDNVDIRFFSWTGPDTPSYHEIVSKAGFQIIDYGQPISRAQWNTLLEDEHTGRGFRDVDFLKASIRDCVRALKEFQPHVIVHGLQPDAVIAARILGIPDVQYGPIPIDRDYMSRHILTDIPDSMSNWFTRLWPRVLRKKVIQRMMRQHQKKPSLVYQAAIDCGWHPKKQGDLLVYNTANCFLLLDLPRHYVADDLPDNVHIIGPLFASSESAFDDLPPSIRRVMEMPSDKPKVFVTMGSTGNKDVMVEAVKAVCCGDFCAIVSLPPSRCTIRELLESIPMKLPETVVLTESFLPARQLAAWADVVVGHGGQGTVQTALASGTPIVGIGLQFEQEWNLESAVRLGACLRLTKRQWKAEHISRALRKVMANESYRLHAKEIEQEMKTFNAAGEAAAIVLQVARKGANER